MIVLDCPCLLVTLVPIKMKKLSLFIITLFLFASCKSQKNEYKVINSVINQDFSKERGCDTVDIVKKTIVLNDYFFKTYKKEKKEKESGLFSTAQIFNWVNQNEKWILNEDDLIYMENIIAESMTLKNKKIKNDKIKYTLIDRPFLGNKSIFENDPQEFKKITKRIVNCRPLYELSTPIFNKDKTIAIIVRNQILVDNFNYLIYKLDDNQWKLVGYTEHSTE